MEAIRLTMTSSDSRGRPRHLFDIWAKRRCSTLFHLLVLGGRWHTSTSMPPRSQNPRGPGFHRRDLPGFEPPPSQHTSRREVPS